MSWCSSKDNLWAGERCEQLDKKGLIRSFEKEDTNKLDSHSQRNEWNQCQDWITVSLFYSSVHCII